MAHIQQGKRRVQPPKMVLATMPTGSGPTKSPILGSKEHDASESDDTSSTSSDTTLDNTDDADDDGGGEEDPTADEDNNNNNNNNETDDDDDAPLVMIPPSPAIPVVPVAQPQQEAT